MTGQLARHLHARCSATVRSLAFVRTKIQPPTRSPQRGNSTDTAEFIMADGSAEESTIRQSHQDSCSLGMPKNQTSTSLVPKSLRLPPCAYLPKKIMQLRGHFYHDLSSFPAELNKRWRVLKWFNHVLQWVSDSSGFRKNSGFFLAHRPVFQTQCFLLTIPVFISSGFHWIKLEA